MAFLSPSHQTQHLYRRKSLNLPGTSPGSCGVHNGDKRNTLYLRANWPTEHHLVLKQFNHIRVPARAVRCSVMLSRNLHPDMSSHSWPCARPRRTDLCTLSSGTHTVVQILQQSMERRNISKIPKVTLCNNYTVSRTKL